MESYEPKQNLVSEFNQNALIISRLHNDWLEAKNYRQNGNLIKYRDKLQSLQVELYCDSDEKYLEQIELLDKKIAIAQFKRKLGILFTLLLQKELILKKIEHESGKGATYKDPEDDDWG